MRTSQKWWFSVALLGAPVGVSKGLVGPRSLRSRGPIKHLIVQVLMNGMYHTHIGTECNKEGLQASMITSRPIRFGCCKDCRYLSGSASAHS